MAVNNRSKARGLWLEIQLRQDVDYIYGSTVSLENLALGQGTRPAPAINVPAHRGYRSNLAQLSKYFLIAYVACVHDVIRAA
jgi:hypothetical protein